jgi:excinuclease UvrABC nuclease subunit
VCSSDLKDILPKFNRELRDGKTFPYLEIDVREDFPRVRFTREAVFTHTLVMRASTRTVRWIKTEHPDISKFG